jgi:hypothetical protein
MMLTQTVMRDYHHGDDDDKEGLTYRPRTTETREVYELILSTVHIALGDQA